MNTRELILDRAAGLLAESPNGDISTRAVCEAAGITQPVLYRLFGDKDGLLAAVVDRVWEAYLSTKRDAAASDDPIDDLRAGWDNHTAFALAHPHAYRLVFGSSLSSRPRAMDEAMSLLTSILGRAAAQGRLRIAPDEAARVVMAANSGVALGLILRAESYPDAAISAVVREATLSGILSAEQAPAQDAVPAAAVTLKARLTADADEETTSAMFTSAEAGLLTEWLSRLA